MNITVATLVLISCFMHAAWNLLARWQRSEVVFIGRMLNITFLIGALPFILSELRVHSLNEKAWFCVAISGICCGVYYFALARAYGSSDFTVVYPIARSLPVLFVAIGDVSRGRGITTYGWVGMVLVVFGCFLSPLHSFRDFQLRRYANRSVLWMILTALGTVGYTLLDKVASETIKQGSATAAIYGYFFFLIAYIIYSLLVKLSGTEKTNSNVTGWAIPFIAAFLNYGAYWLVLWAYQLSQHAAYILAFRQFSVVVGVVYAFYKYKEKGAAVRLTGTFLISFGLLLISILSQ